MSSMLSSEIKGISGADLEILSIIYSHKSIEDSELEKQFSAPNYHQITSYLHANHYIKHGSPWTLTPRGREVVEKARKKCKEMVRIITTDTFLFSLAEASGTFD